jgi:hypothetical protein
MSVALATVVALLLLNFMDEHFNDARYTRAAMAMLSRSLARSGRPAHGRNSDRTSLPRLKSRND